jgi:nitrite reductase/ring-hydroxylating ferredoxin subunit
LKENKADRGAATGYVVGAVAEIPPGARKLVEVAGRSIGVFNVGDSFYALRNRCPHQGGPLCEGRLSGIAVASRPGEVEYLRDGEILRCPWHGWEFDVKTGQSWIDPERLRVRAYPVTVEPAGALPAAETYDVTVERGMLVVHVRGDAS